MYTVKEVAELLGLSVHAVRYYTDMGLIPTLIRDKNNNRLFDEESVKWLIGIKNLRGGGMSINAIKHYVDLCMEGDCTIPERYEIILKQKQAVDVKLKEITEQAVFFEKKVKHYENIMNDVIPDDTNPAKWKTIKGDVAV